MEKNTSRFEAFSDGVFAIAITMLALEIRIPEAEGVNNTQLWTMVMHKWPEYLTFINSFAVVFLVWLGHHRMVEKLKDTNQWLMLANALVLLLITLLPYPTRTAGSFMGTEAAEAAVVMFVLYTASIVLGMILFNLGIRLNPQLLRRPQQDLPGFQRLLWSQLAGLVAYLGIAAAALYWPLSAMWLTALVWIFWAYTTRHDA